VVPSSPSLTHSWVGRTLVAGWPCLVGPQSPCVLFSYGNTILTHEYYECAVALSKNLCQTRLPPALHHKKRFAYEYILAHAITCRDMHVHAVLSSKEDSILSMTEERMSRWPHRPDV